MQKDKTLASLLKSKFPPKGDLLGVFWVILAVTNILAYFGFFINIDAFILKYSVMEILGIFTYVMSFALVEGIFVLFILLVLNIVLPTNWLRDRFMVRSSILYFLGTIFLYPWIGFTSSTGFSNFYLPLDVIPQKTLFLVLWLGAAILLLIALFRITNRDSNRIKFSQFVERIRVLSFIYLAIDSISILFVAIQYLR